MGRDGFQPYYSIDGSWDDETTNNATLNIIRNKMKLKNAMLGEMLWNSLTPSFQSEIDGETNMSKYK